MKAPSTLAAQDFRKKLATDSAHSRISFAVAALIPIAIFSFSACSYEDETQRKSRVFEAWDVINEPSRFGRTYEVRLDKLPMSGRIDRIPWSDSYWSTQRAGIAYRWLSPSGSPFAYSLPSRQIRTKANIPWSSGMGRPVSWLGTCGNRIPRTTTCDTEGCEWYFGFVRFIRRQSSPHLAYGNT